MTHSRFFRPAHVSLRFKCLYLAYSTFEITAVLLLGNVFTGVVQRHSFLPTRSCSKDKHLCGEKPCNPKCSEILEGREVPSTNPNTNGKKDILSTRNPEDPQTTQTTASTDMMFTNINTKLSVIRPRCLTIQTTGKHLIREKYTSTGSILLELHPDFLSPTTDVHELGYHSLRATQNLVCLASSPQVASLCQSLPPLHDGSGFQ